MNEIFLSNNNIFNDIYKIDELLVIESNRNLLLESGLKWINRLSICLEGFTWIIKNKLLESSLFFKSRLNCFINSLVFFITSMSMKEIKMDDNNLIFYSINEISNLNKKRFNITFKILNFIKYLIENSMDIKNTFDNFKHSNIFSNSFIDLLNYSLYNIKILGNDLEEKDTQQNFYNILQKLFIQLKNNEIYFDYKNLISKLSEQEDIYYKQFIETYHEINFISKNTNFLNSIYILNTSGFLKDIIKFNNINEYNYFSSYLNCLEKLKNNENPSFDLIIKQLLDICIINSEVQEECWAKLLVNINLIYILNEYYFFINKN